MLAGSRPIVVRDRRFRWVFSGRPDRWGNSPSIGLLIVQEEGRGKRPLSVKLESKRWVSEEAHNGDTGWVSHRPSLLPSDVARVIEAALDSGWGSAEATHSEPPELSDYRIVP